MDAKQKKRLETQGWKFGSASDFLGLTSEEESLTTVKVALTRQLRQTRVRQKLTQTKLAKRLNTSQSRIAKMEAADSSVSLDAIMLALFNLGVTPNDVFQGLQSISQTKKQNDKKPKPGQQKTTKRTKQI